MAQDFPIRAKGPPRGKEYLRRPPELALASEGEVKVYWGLKRLRIPFICQVNYEGGAGYPGGTRVDFQLTDRAMVVYYHGPFWHSTLYSRAKDLVNELALRARGITPVILWWWEVDADVEGAIMRKVGYALGGRRSWAGSAGGS